MLYFILFFGCAWLWDFFFFFKIKETKKERVGKRTVRMVVDEARSSWGKHPEGT